MKNSKNSVYYYDPKTGTYKPPSLFQSLRSYLKRRRIEKVHKRRKAELEPRREEIISQFFSDVEPHLRQPSIAKVGGFRPSENPAASWFGNVLLAKPNEQWPEYKGKPLNPLIQINIKEAPLVPEKLQRYSLITVFMDEDIPFDKPNGEGWLLRAYESVDGLVALKRPGTPFSIKSFPIQWMTGELEGPCWEDVWDVTHSEVLKEFNILNDYKDDTDLYYSKYQNSERSKLGGWPSLVQHELKLKHDEYLFQVSYEEKANWICIDHGSCYFGLDQNSNWKFECQFF